MKLPQRLRQALHAANGGEWTFARHEDLFIPKDFGQLAAGQLWDYLLQPIERSMAGEKWLPKDFLGRYLPLGDDYAGEILLLDLKSAPCFRVLSSRGDGYGTIKQYDEVSASFDEYCAQCEAEPPARERSVIAVEQFEVPAPQPFAKRAIKVRGVQVQGLDRSGGLWYKPLGVPGEPYRLRYAVSTWSLTSFGSAWFDVGGSPTLVRESGGALASTSYKNHILANEANQALVGRKTVKPLDGRSRPTLQKDTIHIYETAFRRHTQPPTGGAVDLAIVAVRDGKVQVLKLELEELSGESAAEAAITHLLGFGFDWFS